MPGVVGYAGGAFDLFHIGHLNVLRHAREHCDHLVAGVATDEMLLATKGNRPVIPQAERLEIVASVGLVDEAVLEDTPDKLEIWHAVHFDVLFKGDDWRGTARGRRMERDLATVGARVVYFPYTMHTSSTLLRRALGELAAAAV